MLIKTELVDRIIREPVEVPTELTVPCFIGGRIVSTYGDVAELSFDALDALTDCDTRMTAIRGLSE